MEDTRMEMITLLLGVANLALLVMIYRKMG